MREDEVSTWFWWDYRSWDRLLGQIRGQNVISGYGGSRCFDGSFSLLKYLLAQIRN